MNWKTFANTSKLRSERGKLGEHSKKIWSMIKHHYLDENKAVTKDELSELEAIYLYNHACHRSAIDKGEAFTLDLCHLPFHKKTPNPEDPIQISGIELPILLHTILLFIQNEAYAETPPTNTSIKKIDLSFWPGNQSLLLPGLGKGQWNYSPGVSIMQCREYLENISNLEEIEMSHSEIIAKIPEEMRPFPKYSGMPTHLNSLVWDMAPNEKHTVRSLLHYINCLCAMIYPDNTGETSVKTISLAGMTFDIGTREQRRGYIELEQKILTQSLEKLEQYSLKSNKLEDKSQLLDHLLKKLKNHHTSSGPNNTFFSSPSPYEKEITKIIDSNLKTLDKLLSELSSLELGEDSFFSSLLSEIKLASIVEGGASSTEELLMKLEDIAFDDSYGLISIIDEIRIACNTPQLEELIADFSRARELCPIL